MSSLAQRSLAWVLLAFVGNLIVLAVPLTLSLASLTTMWAPIIDAIVPFVLPAYSPTLLFFTVILTILERSDRHRSGGGSDHAQANRLIANSVRFALIIVLSFASVVVISRPTHLAVVLFAALVGFVAIVRAELMDPPRSVDVEAVYRRAEATHRDADQWAARVLGPRWREDRIASRSAPTLLAFFAIPVLVPAAGIVVTACILWGAGEVLTAKFVTMSIVLMVGPAVLVMAWLSSADKSESPRSRNWRKAFLILMGAVGTFTLAGLFLASGPDWAWVGVIVLIDAAAVSLCLWTPVVPAVAERRRRLERRWTQKRLGRLTKNVNDAEARWEAERIPPPRTVRVLAGLMRPFRAAYHLARPSNEPTAR